ncbi:hypothetical protein [Nonomuraea rubra]|uniref:hypothetical protein n=1 Tax=Nonomuraea rubra TaxID=46180 RepID=UPI0033EE6A1F
MPEVITWHELSNPAQIRTNVAKYRQWERAILGGNLSDSAEQANRGNGQWWLLNAYGQMTGDTVKVDPPRPDVSYTLQGLATLDAAKAQVRALFGGTSGNAGIRFDKVSTKLFGHTVHALIQEIPWTGRQIGDSAQPDVIADLDVKVTDGSVAFDFGGALPKLKESSAYQIILTPGGTGAATAKPTRLWQASHEAEDAAHTGSAYRREGPRARRPMSASTTPPAATTSAASTPAPT